jgi:hypothetical protein
VRAPTSDSRNVRVIQFAPHLTKNLLLLLPAVDNTRPRLAQDLTLTPMALGCALHKTTFDSTAAAFKTFLQRFQNLLPVGYMTRPKDSLPVSTFLEATRTFQKILSGGLHNQTHGVPSPLQATRSFHQEVIHPPKARTAKGLPTIGYNDRTDPPFSLS